MRVASRRSPSTRRRALDPTRATAGRPDVLAADDSSFDPEAG